MHRHESAKYELSELTQDVNHQSQVAYYLLIRSMIKRSLMRLLMQWSDRRVYCFYKPFKVRAQRIANVPDYVIEKENTLRPRSPFD